MARRMMRKHHVRCRAGEKVEITSKPYLSLCTLDQCGRFLQREKYRVRVFNSIDFSKSMHYNPLAYIKTESDVLKFVTALIANTKGARPDRA